MKPLHEELKDARIEKGVTLDDIHRATRIRTHFLERIETGDFSVAPEPFLRAFLREYAEVVGIDPLRVMARYDGKPVPLRGGNVAEPEPVTEPEPAPPVAVEEPPEIQETLRITDCGLRIDKEEQQNHQSESSSTSQPSNEPVEPEPTILKTGFYPDDEPGGRRTGMFIIFGLLILIATIVILFLNGIISFR